MITLAWLGAFLAIVLVFAYNRASLIVWDITLFLFLLFASLFSHLGLVWDILVWVVFAVLACVITIKALRRRFITTAIFHVYKKIRPKLSQTEREALTVGTVGWEGELFSGMPNWNQFFSFPPPKLSAEETAFLNGPVETLCSQLDSWDINHNRFNLPTEIWQFLKDEGFFGMIIPKRYGGKEFSALMHSAVIAKVGGRCGAAATVIGVPNSLGPAELLLRYGTETQKNYYLPRLACGEEIPCFGLTSPEGGSDAGSMPDFGIICKGQWEGQEVLGMRLQWNKRYITLAPVATLLGLAFKLFDPEHLLGKTTNLGITCALIPTDTAGVKIGQRHFPLYSAFPNGPTQGHDVFVPLDFIIGGPAMAGKGWQMLMQCLAAGRAITLPALATGGAKVASFTSGAYAVIRQQFHRSIGNFEGIEEVLARIAGLTYIMDAARLFSLAAIDRGEHPAIPSSICKYHVTEMGRKVMNDAMDIHGGKGICMGPRNYLAQSYVETPIAITVEGANILTRCMIIFGQGAMRCHPYLFKEWQAAENPDSKQGLIQFDQLLFAHFGYLISNKVRAFLLGLSNGLFAVVPKNTPAKYYYKQLSRFSAAFAFAADISLLTLGAEFKQRESLSARLGDVLSMLYLGSSLLKHFEDCGSPEEDWPLVDYACQTIMYQLEAAFSEALRNYPKRWLGRLMRIVVFPLGKHAKLPHDKLAYQVANLIQTLSKTRERLTEGAYLKPDLSNYVGLMGVALEKIKLAEPFVKVFRKAVHEKLVVGETEEEQLQRAVALGILKKEELQLIQEANTARREVIAVDDFSVEALRVVVG